MSDDAILNVATKRNNVKKKDLVCGKEYTYQRGSILYLGTVGKDHVFISARFSPKGKHIHKDVESLPKADIEIKLEDTEFKYKCYSFNRNNSTWRASLLLDITPYYYLMKETTIPTIYENDNPIMLPENTVSVLRKFIGVDEK